MRDKTGRPITYLDFHRFHAHEAAKYCQEMVDQEPDFEHYQELLDLAKHAVFEAEKDMASGEFNNVIIDDETGEILDVRGDREEDNQSAEEEELPVESMETQPDLEQQPEGAMAQDTQSSLPETTCKETRSCWAWMYH